MALGYQIKKQMKFFIFSIMEHLAWLIWELVMATGKESSLLTPHFQFVRDDFLNRYVIIILKLHLFAEEIQFYLCFLCHLWDIMVF